MGWLRRLRGTFVTSRMDDELDEEMRFHVEQRTAQYVKSGMSVEEAGRLARRRVGNVTLAREQTRDVDTVRWLQNLGRDVRYASRALRKAPAFAIAAILTFALGVGANVAIFSVVYGVLLRPLPYKNPERLVFIQTRDAQSGVIRPSGFSGPDLKDWKERAGAFDALALCSRDIFALETAGGFETINGAYVSEQFFSILNAPMVLGQPLNDSRAPELVISDRLWRRSFGADAGVVRRTVRLNNQPYTIVGVARADVELPTDTRRSLGEPVQVPDLWAPAEFAPRVDDRRSRYFQFVARLKAGVTVPQARSAADATAHSIAADHAAVPQRFDPVVVPLADEVTGAARPVLLLFLGAVGLMLMVACANVANLLLARQVSRSREIAIRVALGASRSRLAVQLLAEASVLALLGGLAGALIAKGTVTALRSLAAGLPRLDAIRVDIPVLLFAFAVSALAALLSAAVPLVQLVAGHRAAAPRPGGRTVSARTRRLRSALVIAELALSLILLTGAVLLGRSFVNLLRTDMGATADRVVTVELNLAMGRVLPEARQVQLMEQVIERIRVLPDVHAVGAANGLPPNRTRMSFVFETPDARTGTPRLWRWGHVNPTPGYFEALGVPVLNGRRFSTSDGSTSPSVVIISATAARSMFGTLDVIGRALPVGPKLGPALIVGVVGDVKYGGLDRAARETLYTPFAQRPFRNVTLVVRTSGDPRFLAANLAHVIHAVDREITAGPVRSLDDVVSEEVAQPRFRTALLSAIAGLTLILAAIGLYGVVAYSVTQRTPEIGVRLALGATRSHIVGMVLREAFILASVGTAIGLAGAYALTRTLSALLYGVTPTDGFSLGVAAASLMAITVVASYVPAQRAAGIDPILTLRIE